MGARRQISAILHRLEAIAKSRPASQQAAAPHTKPVQIGDGNLTIDLPSHLAVTQEEDNVTQAYDPRSEHAYLRLSALYISDKNNPHAQNLAVKGIYQSAERDCLKVHRMVDKYYTVQVSPSNEESEEADVHRWSVAMDNTFVIITLWMSRLHRTDLCTQALLDCVVPAISSLRLSTFQVHEVEGKHKLDCIELSSEHSELLRGKRRRISDEANSLLGKPGLLGGGSDLHTIQSILDKSLHKGDSQLLEALGVVLGDLLAKSLDLRWMTVTDDWGSTAALVDRGSGLVYYAQDMIAKRVERGETVNVAALFNTLVQAHNDSRLKENTSIRHDLA